VNDPSWDRGAACPQESCFLVWDLFPLCKLEQPRAWQRPFFKNRFPPPASRFWNLPGLQFAFRRSGRVPRGCVVQASFPSNAGVSIRVREFAHVGLIPWRFKWDHVVSGIAHDSFVYVHTLFSFALVVTETAAAASEYECGFAGAVERSKFSECNSIPRNHETWDLVDSPELP